MQNRPRMLCKGCNRYYRAREGQVISSTIFRTNARTSSAIDRIGNFTFCRKRKIWDFGLTGQKRIKICLPVDSSSEPIIQSLLQARARAHDVNDTSWKPEHWTTTKRNSHRIKIYSWVSKLNIENRGEYDARINWEIIYHQARSSLARHGLMENIYT